jgi:hypothetical protein
MCMKLEDRAAETFRLPQHEMQRFVAGWVSGAERLRLGANRPIPIGK